MEKFETRLLQPAEYHLWDKLVEDSPQGSIYSKSFWLAAIAGVYKLKYSIFGCFQQSKLEGGIGLFYRKDWGKRIVFNPPLTPYTGLVIKQKTGKPGKNISHNIHVAEQIIKELEKEFDYVKLIHHWEVKDIRPFTWAGWDSRTIYSFVVPLENLDALFASLDNRDRKPIKTAESLGFTCQLDTDYKEFYRIFELTFAKQNLPTPVPPEIFFPLIEILSLQNACRLYLIKNKEKKIIAGMVVLVDASGPHAWVGGTDPDYLNSGATSFMYWQIFRDLAGEFSLLDLNGANIKNIARFKQNMGAVLIPYYATTKINSPFLKTAKIAKEIPKIWK